MIGYKALKNTFDGHLQEARNNNRSMQAGRLAGIREMYDDLGMHLGANGKPAFDADDRGIPILRPGRASPKEYSIQTIAEALMGHEFVKEYYHPVSGFDFGLDPRLQEAAIDPSAFINVSTLNLAISGLVNAEIMERFNQPEFIGRNLVTIKPTKMNGQKMIGVARMPTVSKAAKGRMPGEQHAEIGFTDVYQTTPETLEQALKCRVTKEAVFYDLTGEVLDEAGMVGHECAYQQEKDIADMLLGVTSSYNRNGTSYSTYQTATPYINDFVNPFSDETDVDDARQLFVNMLDPESGKEIIVNAHTILCMPGRELKFREQIFGTNVQIGTQAAGNFPARWTESKPQLDKVGGGAYTVQALSAIWYNRATASDGLALSASDAKEYWWVGDPQKAGLWMENWPLTPWQANADELVMKDTGLIAVFGANYRGVPFMREPRFLVRNKPS